MKTLYVVPNLHANGIFQELDLLLTDVSSEPNDVRVCCLGADEALSKCWHGAGRSIDMLDWRRWLDPRPLWALAGRIREFRPEIVVAWGLSALRAVRLAAPKAASAIVVRKPIPSDRRRHALSRLDRWLLHSADRIIVSSSAEADRCLAGGLPSDRLRIVSPGVKSIPSGSESAQPRIVCAGALLPHKGFYDAIWAFDIMRFVHSEVELVIAGEGPQRRQLENFVARTGLSQRIHLLGAVEDIAPLLTQAWMVWVPSLSDSGTAVALQAMAAGRPMVASRWPGLAEVVQDGETGYLVEPASKMELTRQTRRLLDDAALRRRMGDAGRRRATERFSPTVFVKGWTNACRDAANKQGDFCCQLRPPA